MAVVSKLLLHGTWFAAHPQIKVTHSKQLEEIRFNTYFSGDFKKCLHFKGNELRSAIIDIIQKMCKFLTSLVVHVDFPARTKSLMMALAN